MGLSTTEILVIAVVVLLLFGAKKIPEIARSLGRASYEFKKAKEDLVRETRELEEVSEKNAALKAENEPSSEGKVKKG
jgi:sec-independent protein translocase protein TatA